MTARVLLTGASGLLGTWLRRTAPVDVDVTSLVRSTPVADGDVVRADLRDLDATRTALTAARPDVVVHAAYVIDEASIVAATANVVAASAQVGAEVVLISTDAVFAGDGHRRDEDDQPDPVWDYGRWKASAEQAVLASPHGAIVRLPLVVSIDPPDGAVAKVSDAAGRGEATTWFDDEVRQPAMASELAAAIWAIAALPAEERAGAWHLMGPERLTRREIAERIAAVLRVEPALVRGEPTPPHLVRPRDLHLGDDRARRQLGWAPTPILGGS